MIYEGHKTGPIAVVNQSVFFIIVSFSFSECSRKCDICEKDWLISQYHCIDCDKYVCKFCIHSHKLEAHNEVPKTLRVEIKQSSVHLTSAKYCAKHKDQTLQLFCKTCNQPICISCSCDSHKSHHIQPISIKLEQSKTFLQKELDRLSKEKRNSTAVASQLEQNKNKIIEVSNCSMLALDAAAEKACTAIMQSKSQLEKEILVSEKKQINSVEEILTDYNNYSTKLNRIIEFLTDLQDDDICLEVVDTYLAFLEKINCLKTKFASKRLNVKLNTFTQNNSSFAKRLKLFGHNLLCHFNVLGGYHSESFYLVIDDKKMEMKKQWTGVTLIKMVQILTPIIWIF